MTSRLQFIEPLEARIAPAVLVTGGNLLGGLGNPTTGETSSGGNTVTLVKVISGQALVFFDASTSEITGISVGKHTQLDITGNVYGDIVTNLGPDGRLTDSDGNPANGEDGGILLGFGIKGITTHPLGGVQFGNIGRIIAGGTVKNVDMAAGSMLSGVYAGDGIFRDGPTITIGLGTNIDYNTIQPGLQNQFVLTQANAAPTKTGDIRNIEISSANQLQLFAGDGNANTAGPAQDGGSISNVTIAKTLAGSGSQPAAYLHAGDGGSGIDGGAGGSITNFNDQGSIAYVKVQTGNGGAASGGAGGDGGSFTASSIITSSPRYDLVMGYGGDGVTGGKGGSITTLNFVNDVTGGQSLVATGDFNNDGYQDVLLINTLTGTATLSLGHAAVANDPQAPFTVALQTTTNASGATVSTPFIAPEGAVPTDVSVGDVNGDGILDYVVSYQSTDNVGVYIGHGDGTFTASSVALPGTATKVTIGNYSGSTALDLAVLSSGNAPSANGGLTSQIYIAQGDGTGAFVAPTGATATIAGFATDLATAQVDGTNGNDLFVSLNNGQIVPLLDTAAGTFTQATPITAFATATGSTVSVDNIDVGMSSPGQTALLAFTKDSSGTATTGGTAVPEVEVLTVNTSGAVTSALPILPETGTTLAHFVAGTQTVGTVAPDALTLYSPVEGAYTVLTALGGNSGVLSDFASSATNDGVYHIAGIGSATSRFFYAEGNPFSTAGIATFKPFDIPFTPAEISFVAGNGGHGTTLNGGAGGDISSISFAQTLGGGVVEAGGSYNTIMTTGNGGASDSSTGGHGGDITSVSLSLNPAYLTVQNDTTFASLTTGTGGSGATGGSGGSMNGVSSVSVFTEVLGGAVTLDSVALQLVAGNGGVGTVAAGGAGGTITLSGKASLTGVSFFDSDSLTPDAPALLVEGGKGGDGVTAGGVGGSLINIGSQNANVMGASLNVNELESALIVAGSGGNASNGNGGVGGSIMGMDVSVQKASIGFGTGVQIHGGSVTVISGSGGTGTNGLGGNAGNISKSAAASIDGDDVVRNYGVLLEGGVGGSGTLGGGNGGSVKQMTINTPSADDVYAGAIVAGNGGAALVSGNGGNGGSVKGISQSKDVDSSISVIQGGNGGTSANGLGGAGGLVKNIDTEGFIGLPATSVNDEYLGVYNPTVISSTVAALFADNEVPQGIFAGRGADGAANGSVLNIVARQVAAIGASVDAAGLFAPASSVTNVQTDLIGYDQNQNGIFDTVAGQNISPSQAVPIDGFILASTVSEIVTLQPTRTAAFTFAS